VLDGRLGREVCEFGMTPKQGKARELKLPTRIMADLYEQARLTLQKAKPNPRWATHPAHEAERDLLLFRGTNGLPRDPGALPEMLPSRCKRADVPVFTPREEFEPGGTLRSAYLDDLWKEALGEVPSSAIVELGRLVCGRIGPKALVDRQQGVFGRQRHRPNTALRSSCAIMTTQP
jgi:hypothetical protein